MHSYFSCLKLTLPLQVICGIFSLERSRLTERFRASCAIIAILQPSVLRH